MEKMLQVREYSINTTTEYPSRESLRVLSAAVVSPRFRKMLLVDVRKAVSTGYAGEKFHLDEGEISWLSSIRANSLPEFARQMTVPSYPVTATAAYL
jgi:hypothetical protein